MTLFKYLVFRRSLYLLRTIEEQEEAQIGLGSDTVYSQPDGIIFHFLNLTVCSTIMKNQMEEFSVW